MYESVTVDDMPSAERTSKSKTSNRITLYPDLTSFRKNLPVLGRTEIIPFSEDYQQPAAPERCASVTADLRVVNCNRLGH